MKKSTAADQQVLSNSWGEDFISEEPYREFFHLFNRSIFSADGKQSCGR